MSSDLPCMERGGFRYDLYMVLLPTAYVRSANVSGMRSKAVGSSDKASAGVAKPNAKTLCTGSVLKCGVW